MAKTKQIFTLVAECKYNSFCGTFSTLKAAKEHWKQNCQIGAKDYGYVIYCTDINETIYYATNHEAHRYPAIEHEYNGVRWAPKDLTEYERIFNS
jgi:hypothetical protein